MWHWKLCTRFGVQFKVKRETAPSPTARPQSETEERCRRLLDTFVAAQPVLDRMNVHTPAPGGPDRLLSVLVGLALCTGLKVIFGSKVLCALF